MQSVVTFAALLAVAVFLVPFFKRAGLGTVLGYLVAGVLIGPWGVSVVHDPENLLHTAELGVVLLLFIIGLELQPSRLWALRKPVFGLGTLQFFGVGALLIGVARLLGLDWAEAVLAGLALALSSTAFVLPTLAERNELHSRYGRETFAMLLFQDLMVIPLLALLPLLGAEKAEGSVSPVIGLVVLGVVIAIGRPLLDRVFRHVSRIDSREMFTAAALATALGLALLMEASGLSMSLGAFVAGVLLSDSDFRHELEGSIAPFQGLLMGFFFIAVGMGINLGMIVQHPINVIGFTVGLLAIKGFGLYGLRRLVGGGAKESRMEALALAQCGEFAFVLFGVARASSLLPLDVVEQLTLAVALSMAIAPLLFIIGDRINAKEVASQPERPADEMPDEPNPVVIAGFGRVGQIIGRILRVRGVPFTALDKDLDEVDMVRRFGAQAYYGNAAHLEVLDAARVGEAKVLILAIDDIETSIRCAELVRKHFPHVQIVARARDRFHAYRLMDLGVTLQMRETFKSSLALATMTFEALGKPPAAAQHIVDLFARNDQELLKRQQALYHDESQLIQSTKDAYKELAALLEQELAAAAKPDAEKAPPKS
ncbi:MAG: monovalent cation:proton antiporter-2 (CPA2) family protein [Azoarcus sp.]|jgi:monovalent cation:proton antiporter-2 (CPA2) family protein|nr:monovalent cation:proton antiporter-2 (CPA2) family protein [Azoarcus sp.]MDD2873376.1 monovalent cation:proton antiporter-2 (CPA2) family protein [Azoarcus sp.]MDX9838728.1 monovalent cation:proton antiporter-2 (CPA2) family protein [Azoarcus sp.]